MSVVAILLAMGEAGPTPPTAVTWNPSDKDSNISLSGGNLIATKSSGGEAYASLRATTPRPATDPDGFYFEVVVTSGTTSNFMHVGVCTGSMPLNSHMNNSEGWAYQQQAGNAIHNGSGTAYGSPWTTGDVLGFLLKGGKLYFRLNGTWQGGADVDAGTGAAFSGLSGDLYPAAALYRASVPRHVLTARFTADSFSGSLPTGAKAWDS